MLFGCPSPRQRERTRSQEVWVPDLLLKNNGQGPYVAVEPSKYSLC